MLQHDVTPRLPSDLPAGELNRYLCN
jgi:hypothetical protein